jgi:hypothetical protein
MYYSHSADGRRGAVIAPHFIETTTFTQRVIDLGFEEALRGLQLELMADPVAGDTDAGTGGLRKIRVPAPRSGKGKRGGARVHYLYLPTHRVVYLIFIYRKTDQHKLSHSQKRVLRAVAEQLKMEWQTQI